MGFRAIRPWYMMDGVSGERLGWESLGVGAGSLDLVDFLEMPPARMVPDSSYGMLVWHSGDPSEGILGHPTLLHGGGDSW